MDIKLSPLTHEEQDALVALLSGNFPILPEVVKFDVAAMFQDSHYPPMFYVAVTTKAIEDTPEGEIIGCIGWQERKVNINYYDLMYHVVAEPFRKKGISAALIKEALKELRSKRACSIQLCSELPSEFLERYKFVKLREKPNGEHLYELEITYEAAK